jgi:hypothetical protein
MRAKLVRKKEIQRTLENLKRGVGARRNRHTVITLFEP